MTVAETIEEARDKLYDELRCHDPETAEGLEAKYGVDDVLDDTIPLHREYDVLDVHQPFLRVERKSDGVIGWMICRQTPFFVWGFVPESELSYG